MAEDLPVPGLFITPELRDLFNSRFKQLISDLRQPVTLYFDPMASGCPNCYSAADGSSNGKYTGVANPFGSGKFNVSFPIGTKCPVCKGSHKIYTENSITYNAAVTSNPRDREIQNWGATDKTIIRTKMVGSAYRDIKRAKKALIQGEFFVLFRRPVRTGLPPPQFVKAFWIEHKE